MNENEFTVTFVAEPTTIDRSFKCMYCDVRIGGYCHARELKLPHCDGSDGRNVIFKIKDTK